MFRRLSCLLRHPRHRAACATPHEPPALFDQEYLAAIDAEKAAAVLGALAARREHQAVALRADIAEILAHARPPWLAGDGQADGES